jgi:hypothetical protein
VNGDNTTPVRAAICIRRMLAGIAFAVAGCGYAGQTRGTLQTNAARQIIGCLVDSATGGPLEGVQVYFPGTDVGTLSDTLGFFRLARLASGDSIALRRIGYLPRMLTVPGRAEGPLSLGSIRLSAHPYPSFAHGDPVAAAESSRQYFLQHLHLSRECMRRLSAL